MIWGVDTYMKRHPKPGGKLNVWHVPDDDPEPPTIVADNRGWGPSWWRDGEYTIQGPHRILFDYVKSRHLRAARERAGLSRKECARALGIPTSQLHVYENGLGNVHEEHVPILRAFMERDRNLDER